MSGWLTSGWAQLAEFLFSAWLLSVLVDRCYRGRIPKDLRALDGLPPGIVDAELPADHPDRGVPPTS